MILNLKNLTGGDDDIVPFAFAEEKMFAEQQIAGDDRPLEIGLANVVEVSSAAFDVFSRLSLGRRKTGMHKHVNERNARTFELGLLNLPVFMFQEGQDRVAEQAFREIARLTHGAYCSFDIGAAHQLGELLRAVAAYAAGGMRALVDLSARRQRGAMTLIEQMRS